MTQPEHDPLDISADERNSAKTAEEERLATGERQNDLRWVMSNKRGRRFIYRQLEEAGIWRSSFDIDSTVMAFNEGNRNGGLKLLNEITEACTERYTEMLAEQKQEKDKHEQRTADRRSARR